MAVTLKSIYLPKSMSEYNNRKFLLSLEVVGPSRLSMPLFYKSWRTGKLRRITYRNSLTRRVYFIYTPRTKMEGKNLLRKLGKKYLNTLQAFHAFQGFICQNFDQLFFCACNHHLVSVSSIVIM